jgi:hypothetical protein
MDHIASELVRLRDALHREPPISDRRAVLHAAQQALVWALEPDVTLAPFDYAIFRTAEGSAGCSEGSRHATL